jgi:hypothetical protein
MSLRVLAALDAAAIVQDLTGFGWPVIVTSPDGVSAGLVGLSTDIQHSIDPDTGTAITARRASVSLVTSALQVAFGAVPRGIADGTSKPWLVRFADIHGTPQTFKVRETAPDRAIGLTTCILEWYRAG